MNRRLILGSVLLSLLVVVAFAISAFVFYKQQDLSKASDEQICQAFVTTRLVLRDILEDARARALGLAENPAARASLAAYYARLLAKADVLVCPSL